MDVVFDSASGSYTIPNDGYYEIVVSGTTTQDSHVYLNGFTILYASNSGNIYRQDAVFIALKKGAQLTKDGNGRMVVRHFY